MTSAAAQRMRAHRARAAQGRATLHVEAELEPLADLLKEGEYLTGEFDFEDPAKVARALEKFLEHVILGKNRIIWWRDA